MASAEARRKMPPACLETLRARFGPRMSTSAAVLESHGHDESYHASAPPDVVIFPESIAELVEIVAMAREHQVPLIPFGAGTSLEGHVAALSGGISVDMTRMNRILAVNAADLDARVEAGVTRKELNAAIRDAGLFFPVDPGADASIGGMTATRASGTNAVRYGTMRENVLGLTVVLADGRVIRTGGRARKSAAGYDLTRLFVGSEGTLGIIAEVTVRLYGLPEAMSAAVVSFPSVEAAVETVILTIQSGIPVARIELLDAVQMEAINRYSKLDYPAQPTLFFEFHGSERAVVEQAEAVGAIAAEWGGGDFQWATRPEDRTRLWQARHDAYYAALALRPGAKGWATDVCVPISALAQCIAETRADVAQAALLAPIVGHVGDGNFHLVFVIDPNDPDELERARAVNERMVLRAIAMGGTSTGEHGIGCGKLDFLTAEHGEAVAIMRQIKQALDPMNLMNPGKVVRV
ncbi:MAG: FAD-binding protein [Rhodospirillales bacterium]|nr:FAD-binding protein [Rhodospirillales bacterium]